MGGILEKATSLNVREEVGEKLKAIEEKIQAKVEDVSETLEEQDIEGAVGNIQDALSGLLGGLG